MEDRPGVDVNERDSGDATAMLEIAHLTLRRIALYHARLPADVGNDLRVTLAELELFGERGPVATLPIPPPEDLVIGERRRLLHVKDVDLSVELGRETLLRFWREERKAGMLLAVSNDLTRFGRLLHVSLSYALHLPSWRDVRDVKARLFGDEDAMMVLPKAEDYVNVQPYCLHLVQMPARWAMQ